VRRRWLAWSICFALGCGSRAAPTADAVASDAGDAAGDETVALDSGADVSAGADSRGIDVATAADGVGDASGDAPAEAPSDVAPDLALDAPVEAADAASDGASDDAGGDLSSDVAVGVSWAGGDGPCDHGCQRVVGAGCSGGQPVQWLCQSKHDRLTFQDACSPRPTDSIRYCCASSFLSMCP
jgi:hypothetical protein